MRERTLYVCDDTDRGGAVADVVRTCANCGNVQTSGDFCEKCGTRMPPAVAAAPAAAAAAYQAAPAPAAQPAYSQQPGYGAPPAGGQYGAQPAYTAPPAAGQYGYAAPEDPYRRREAGGWGKLFDLSFQGFVTPTTLKQIYFVVLGLIGAYVLFNIVLVAMFANRFSIISFFISLFVAGLWFFLSRVFFELIATVMRMRSK
jgi:hypothetical protein